MTCPNCQAAMAQRMCGDVPVHQCSSCHGLFLDSSCLGALFEAENDWHAHRSAHTSPIPRITADMSVPPPAAPRSRAFIETLFRE
jgi:uncharacterized protein